MVAFLVSVRFYLLFVNVSLVGSRLVSTPPVTSSIMNINKKHVSLHSPHCTVFLLVGKNRLFVFVHVAVSSFPLRTLLCGLNSTQVESKRHENLHDINICIFLTTEAGELGSSYVQGFLAVGYI